MTVLPLSCHGLLEGHEPPNEDILEKWLDDHGVQRSDALVVTDMEDGQGWRIVANRPMDIGEYICQIPKSALLSTRSSSLPPLPSDTPSRSHLTSPDTILHLSLCLLHELRLGIESPFYGYLQSLPRRTILLPIFWGMEELGGTDGQAARLWLLGTEGERELRRKDEEGLDLRGITDYYNKYSSYLPPTITHPSPSPIQAFLHAYSLVSTRAFIIDLYHQVSLCPFADLLNHSSLSPHTSLATDDYVCHLCGSLPACLHDVPHPFTGVPSRLKHLTLKERERMGMETDYVEMRCEREIETGDEVWNCYAEGAGDAKLLVEWGFVGAEFAGSGLTWTKDEIFGILSNMDSNNYFKRATESIHIILDTILDNFEDEPWRQSLDQDDDENSLFIREIGTTKQPELVNVNQSAQTSTELFACVYLYLLSIENGDNQMNDIEAAQSDLEKDMERLEELWEECQAFMTDGGEVDGTEDIFDDEENGGVVPGRSEELAPAPGSKSDSAHHREIESEGTVDGYPTELSKTTVNGTATLRSTQLLSTRHKRLHKAAAVIKHILASRFESTHRSDLSQSQLLDLRDTLPKDSNLQRMALSLLIDERGILISALDKWEAVIRALHVDTGTDRGSAGTGIPSI